MAYINTLLCMAIWKILYGIINGLILIITDGVIAPEWKDYT